MYVESSCKSVGDKAMEGRCKFQLLYCWKYVFVHYCQIICMNGICELVLEDVVTLRVRNASNNMDIDTVIA